MHQHRCGLSHWAAYGGMGIRVLQNPANFVKMYKKP
jgi:hypothetical protein